LSSDILAMENENSDNSIEASGSDNSFQTDPQVPLCQEIASERNAAHLVSSPRTLMNILRCMVGPGCFALPVSFKMAGLWVSLMLIFVIGFSSAYCMLMLVQCAQLLCSKTGHLELDYGHLAKKAFDYGPIAVRNYSKTALYITNFLICVFQLGVCSVQIVFLAEHFKEVIEHNFQTVPLSLIVYASIMLVFIILISLIRHLRTLSLLATFANIFMLIAFFIIFQKVLSPPNRIASLPGYTNLQGFMLAIGSMLYAFEGQAVILPLENKMKNPKDMLGWNGVLSVSMSIVTCVYAATGFFGYATFGNEVKGSITLNMPDTWLYELVKILLMISVFISYPIQLYVVVEMLWPAIQRKIRFSQERILFIMEFALRISLVLITYFLAIAIPNLEKIIPFVGVTAGIVLGYVFPPIIAIIIYYDDAFSWSSLQKYWFYGKNIFLIFIGIVSTVVGLYANILNLS
ncbi:putative amino acid permease F59B2.2, partial [Trichinella pseudospiralis]